MISRCCYRHSLSNPQLQKKKSTSDLEQHQIQLGHQTEAGVHEIQKAALLYDATERCD